MDQVDVGQLHFRTLGTLFVAQNGANQLKTLRLEVAFRVDHSAEGVPVHLALVRGLADHFHVTFGRQSDRVGGPQVGPAVYGDVAGRDNHALAVHTPLDIDVAIHIDVAVVQVQATLHRQAALQADS